MLSTAKAECENLANGSLRKLRHFLAWVPALDHEAPPCVGENGELRPSPMLPTAPRNRRFRQRWESRECTNFRPIEDVPFYAYGSYMRRIITGAV